MTVKIEAPAMGESISEATVARWAKQEGEFVNQDELIAELETDKINLEVVAPKGGKLAKIMIGEGETVKVGEVMGEVDDSAAAPAAESSASDEDAEETSAAQPEPAKEEPASAATEGAASSSKSAEDYDKPLSPAVRRLVEENSLNPADIDGTGKDGRLTKGDVLAYLEGSGSKSAEASADEKTEQAPAQAPTTQAAEEGAEKRVKMTSLRKTIAGRLKTAQNNAAMLTTYNEVDMSAVMALRSQYKESFEKAHGVKLGFMSFFTRAAIDALKAWPALNAEIDGEELVYKNYYHIGIAVASEKGLVVPVLRDADKMSFADIEVAIRDFGARARDGKLGPADMSNGTFTITNGGVFGSLMSMPILNYPQVGILGMHAIKERPVVVDGEITVRPMMYLALTYDHRIVDGREAVSFLVKIKESLEDPARMVLGV